MNLQNGYKVIYEKAADGKRTFLASKTGVFADAEVIAELEMSKYKLIYEKNGKIYCSESGVPSGNDQCFKDFDKAFVTDMPTVDEPASEEPVQEAHTDAIATNGDSHGKLTIDGNVVTLKATGEIAWLKSATGVFGNWVGFKIKVPEGVDAEAAIYTRPNGTSCKLSQVLDAGKNYASVYSDMSKYGETATYMLDWNGDGKQDLTVTIDATEATLVPEKEPEE